VATARYLTKIPELADRGLDEFVADIAPALQVHLETTDAD
jgi:hypothetical protein